MPLTFTIGWLKLLIIVHITFSLCFFNFHHRVVETNSLSTFFNKNFSFNFHHRVVETRGSLSDLCRLFRPLTFTIGWLKLFFFLPLLPTVISLTFTIGWLKRHKSSLATPLFPTLTFTIGWLKRYTAIHD